MKKQVSAILLAALLLFSASCGDAGTAAEATESAGGGNAAPDESVPEPEETREISFADYPAQDLGGWTLRYGDTLQYDICRFSIREEETGDVLNDAIFRSNRDVEEKLNITIKSVLYDDPGKLADVIIAGEDAFDIATGQDLRMAELALGGYMSDISGLEQLDFGADWWPKHSVDAYTINGKMLLFSNYSSYFGLSRARVWYINKTICADYGLNVPYDRIFDGSWTLDRLIEMINSVYSDVDGNGEKNEGDIFGLVKTHNYICMQPSMGINTFEKNSAGQLEFVFDVNKASVAVDKLYKLFIESPSVFQIMGDNSPAQQIYANGQALYYYDSLGMMETFLRDSDVDYGVVCTPKLDESQPDYIAGYTDYSHGVPITATELDKIGYCIEAMTASGYYTVAPAFVEKSLKNKYSYDEQSAKVIDLIMGRMKVELAYSFSAQMALAFNNLFNSNRPSSDLASYYEKNKEKDLALLERLNTLYS